MDLEKKKVAREKLNEVFEELISLSYCFTGSGNQIAGKTLKQLAAKVSFSLELYEEIIAQDIHERFIQTEAGSKATVEAVMVGIKLGKKGEISKRVTVNTPEEAKLIFENGIEEKK